MSESLDARIKELKAIKHLLRAGDESFAHNLIQYYERKGFLTAKQEPFIDQLLARATEAADRQRNEVEEVFDGHQIRSLLTTAHGHLKFPSLKLQSDNCGTIRFYIAGPLSKTPGYVIIDNGATYPRKVIYGSIESSGCGQLRRTVAQEIKTFIRKVAANPVAEAKLCGIKYAHCCFCGLELTAPTSLHHGYGPICADNWGLPWEGPKPLLEQEQERKHVNLVDLGGTDDADHSKT